MISLNNFFKHSDLSGVICLESASRVNNLSTFPPLPMMLFVESEKDRELGYIHFYSQEKVDTNFTIQAGLNLYVTTPERTIVDLIRYTREERFIFECLERYLRNNKADKLVEVASFYNCRTEVTLKLLDLQNWLNGEEY